MKSFIRLGFAFLIIALIVATKAPPPALGLTVGAILIAVVGLPVFWKRSK